uniref:Uncharacterized protein n=1 Tax=Sphaerodactylus townsendi TaxID=933632 RepID=A0ACB8EVI1_9SAUR
MCVEVQPKSPLEGRRIKKGTMLFLPRYKRIKIFPPKKYIRQWAHVLGQQVNLKPENPLPEKWGKSTLNLKTHFLKSITAVLRLTTLRHRPSINYARVAYSRLGYS